MESSFTKICWHSIYNFRNVELYGFMEKKSNKKNSKKFKKYYYELVDIFLIYSKKPGDPPKGNSLSLIQGIYCLNGLAMEKNTETSKQFGFDIFHRDKIYATKSLFCPTEEERVKWLEHLMSFDK